MFGHFTRDFPLCAVARPMQGSQFEHSLIIMLVLNKEIKVDIGLLEFECVIVDVEFLSIIENRHYYPFPRITKAKASYALIIVSS